MGSARGRWCTSLRASGASGKRRPPGRRYTPWFGESFTRTQLLRPPPSAFRAPRVGRRPPLWWRWQASTAPPPWCLRVSVIRSLQTFVRSGRETTLPSRGYPTPVEGSPHLLWRGLRRRAARLQRWSTAPCEQACTLGLSALRSSCRWSSLAAWRGGVQDASLCTNTLSGSRR